MADHEDQAKRPSGAKGSKAGDLLGTAATGVVAGTDEVLPTKAKRPRRPIGPATGKGDETAGGGGAF